MTGGFARVREVDPRVSNQQGVFLLNATGTKARVSANLLHVDALARLKPDAVFIDDANKGCRHFKQPGRYTRYTIEGLVRGRVENIIAPDDREPLLLVHFSSHCAKYVGL